MTQSAPKTTQEICIDLPGETVQCWRSSDKVRVVLRKHRDVIFDIQLGKGKTYSVHADRSDFYNAKTKKLIEAKLRGSVHFKDGERAHLWIGRDFKGALTLKCDGTVMMRFEPNKLDCHHYDSAPTTKPAPIIIALGGDVSLPAGSPVAKQSNPDSRLRPVSAPVDEQCPIVCVIEATMKGAPKDLIDTLAHGGANSGLADIDPNEIATRNWILGQLAAAGAYTKDNWTWLRASIDGRTHEGFKLVRAKVHFVRGKIRFYFSGYSKFNTVFGPGGFGSAHDRIMSIFAGAGSTATSFKAAAAGALGSLKGNALVAFIFSSAAAIAEWQADNSKDGYDLTASLATSILKGMISAALTAAFIVLVVIGIMVGTGASLTVLAVGLLTVSIGAIVTYAVDAADKALGRLVSGKENSDGMSTVIAPHLRTAGQRIRQNWEYLIGKFTRDYEEIVF